MKLFILGTSQSGKSTLSKYLSVKYNYEHIQSSIMVRNTFNKKEEDFNNKQDFINAITEYSIKLNQIKPHAVSDYIKENYDLNKNVIIEGIRNPNNFFDLYNVTEDIVIILKYHNNKYLKTNFENGIEVIEEYLKWNLNMDILNKSRVQILEYNNYEEIKGLLNEKPLFN